MAAAPVETTPLLERSIWAKPRLLSHVESMAKLPWQTDNEYVLGAYRPQLYTVKACLASAVAYMHNETVNIHTHSLGALVFLALIPLHLLTTPYLATPPTTQDKLAMATYLVCAVACLGLSSWFHTVQACSRGWCESAHRGDYIGIVILIVGSILPGMYYAFHDSLFLQLFYSTAILGAGVASAYIVLSPHHRAHRWHRTLTFIALGLSAALPVTHVVLARGLAFARQRMSLDFILMGGASYIVGALIYAARIPERLCPGTYDLVGSSHQIFHALVLVGAACQYAALRGMVWGRAAVLDQVGGGGA
ncbi:hypothetical protein Q5752_005079 [Cryptotrichosporon argae]